MNKLSDSFNKHDSEIWKSYLFDENDPTSQYFYAKLYKQYGVNLQGKKSNCNNNKCICKKCKKSKCICKK